ncbi:MAG: cellulase family glycosylhydrolase [Ruminococcus sp.]|nr:cellulase family glycosylhydrolase [Ruminococcus sp.]
MKLKRIISALAAAVFLTSFSLSAVTPAADSDTEIPYTKYTITQDELSDAGVSWQGSASALVYVKMTEGGADSKVNAQIMLGSEGEGKVSSKYLVGQNVTSSSGNAIQDNLVGNAGTGCYVFPTLYLNTTTKDGGDWASSDYANYITITIRIDTEDTDCELLGIIFSNGATYNYSEGSSSFTAPTTESTSYDEEDDSLSNKELLKLTLDYCADMDSSKYQADSWTAFQTELASATAVYNSSSSSDSDYSSARSSLEEVKADMLFADTDTEEYPLPWRSLTNEEIIEEMGAGINLGNTMDGHSGFTPSETSWQSVVTTKAYIKALHDAGYNTVRIPVTWGNMIDTENGYEINDAWISRVQDIVDYCVSQDMYAIINVHHDGAEQTGWLRVAADDIDAVYEEYECVWRNIAEYFKDYDEHLIFESMNEITCMDGDDKNSSEAIEYDTPIINNLNQIFVNVVRSTGSNNTHRWLAAVAHYANSGNASAFTLPDDSYNSDNAIMFALHVYKSSTNVTWTYSEVYQVVNNLKIAANKFDVPIILGEYGTRTYTQSRTDTGYNDVARAYFSEIVNRACKTLGCVPIVWDQGYGSDKYETGLYSYWDRTNCEPIFKTITDAMMRGTYLTPSSLNESYNYTDIESDPEIVEFTDISLSDESVTITLGDNYTVTAETSPSDSNDVLLWSTDDDTIATVSQGKIRARGIGITTITAYAQNGDVKQEIEVKVTADSDSATVTAIDCEDSYSVITGKYTYIDAEVSPSDADDYISYKSSNTNIATVNALGKIVGVSAGTTYLTLTSSTGLTKTVKVTVSDVEITGEINLALNVLYNDSTNNYWSIETGPSIAVTEDGQYTLTFDIDSDLSAAGKSAGITTINNLTAIYIQDYDVTVGNATKSQVTAASIRYDSVSVNGTELTVTDSNFYSAMNGSVLDSGKPINAWGGTVVDGISVSNYTASFSNISNPTSISVTFTIQGLTFAEESSSESENAAIALDAVSDLKLVLPNIGDTGELTVKISELGSDSLITFASADSSIAAVDCTALSADSESGYATIKVTAMEYGKTTVTALTDNGYTVTFTVIVGEDDDDDDNDDDDENDDDNDLDEEPTDDTDDDSSDEDNDTDTDDSSDTDDDTSDSDSQDDSSEEDSSSSASSSTATSSSGDTDNPDTGAAAAAASGALITVSAVMFVLKKRK